MAVFRVHVGGQAPLQIQLGPVPSGRMVKVRGVFAYGETTSGSSNDPIVYFPSVIGIGTNVFTRSMSGLDTAVCPIITSFSSAPSFPSGAGAATSLPTRRELYLPRGSEIWVPQNTALVIYASTAGGHSWTAGFEWTEL